MSRVLCPGSQGFESLHLKQTEGKYFSDQLVRVTLQPENTTVSLKVKPACFSTYRYLTFLDHSWVSGLTKCWQYNGKHDRQPTTSIYLFLPLSKTIWEPKSEHAQVTGRRDMALWFIRLIQHCRKGQRGQSLFHTTENEELLHISGF